MGLSALSNNDGAIIFSASPLNSIASTLLTPDRKVRPLGLPVIVGEKCAPTSSKFVFCASQASIPNATYPDDWFMGRVSFSDFLWRIDTENGLVESVLDPEGDFEQRLDIIDPQISTDNLFMTFRNKDDLSLWLVHVTKLFPVD